MIARRFAAALVPVAAAPGTAGEWAARALGLPMLATDGVLAVAGFVFSSGILAGPLR